MAKPRKPKSASHKARVERDIAKIMAATRPAVTDKPLSKQEKLDRDLPWRHSYANWCMHLSLAAAKYNARIDFGSDTYEAWESGISPDTYARQRARR